jgi:hypothetical protein
MRFCNPKGFGRGDKEIKQKTTGFDELDVEFFMMWKMVCETGLFIRNGITNTKAVVASIADNWDGYE